MFSQGDFSLIPFVLCTAAAWSSSHVAAFFWARQLEYQLFSSVALVCPAAISLLSFRGPFMKASLFPLLTLHFSLPNLTGLVTRFYICLTRCSVNFCTCSVSFYSLDSFQVALSVWFSLPMQQRASYTEAKYQTPPTVSDFCILLVFHCVLNV